MRGRKILKRFLITLPLTLLATFFLFLFVGNLISNDILPYSQTPYVKLYEFTEDKDITSDYFSITQSSDQEFVPLECRKAINYHSRRDRKPFRFVRYISVDKHENIRWSKCPEIKIIHLNTEERYGFCEFTYDLTRLGQVKSFSIQKCSSPFFENLSTNIYGSDYKYLHDERKTTQYQFNKKSVVTFEMIKE